MRIFDIRMADGTPAGSVQEAVEKFRCPCMCSPDCPLFQNVRIKGETFGHMCHPEIVSRYPALILDAMRCTYSVHVGHGQEMPREQAYAAVITSGAVRDAQYCADAEHDPLESEWFDLPDARIWLGVFRGENALQKAAKYAGTVPENICLIPLDGDSTTSAGGV